MFFQVGHRFCPHLLLLEFGKPCRAQKGAAPGNHIRHTVPVQRYYLILMQTKITTLNAKHFQTMMQAGTHHSPNGRVHARCITTAGEYSNAFNHEIP